MPEMSLKSGSSPRTADSPVDLRDRLGLPKPPQRGDRPGWAARFTQGIKTFLWVAPLTVLLWVYAEQEKLATRLDVPASIEVRGSSPDRIVTLLSSREISVDLEGPTAGVEQVRSALTDQRSGPLEITVNEQPPFEGDISVAERLSNSDLFKRNVVSVKRASPVRVRVEARIRQDVPLMVRDDQKQIVARILDPRTVSVEGPDSIMRDKRLVAIADVSALANKDLGDATVELPIGLFMKDGDTLTAQSNPYILFQRSIRAKVEAPKVSTVTRTITKSLSVYVDGPAMYMAAPDEIYRIKLDKLTLPNVKVAGPPDAVEQLTGAMPKFKAAVIVHLGPEHFNPALGEQEIKLNPDTDFIMPPGVKVIDAPRISFTITKITPDK